MAWGIRDERVRVRPPPRTLHGDRGTGGETSPSTQNTQTTNCRCYYAARAAATFAFACS